MGMLIEMIVVKRATFRANAASGMADVTSSFLWAFQLLSQSLVCRICHVI